MFKLGFVSLLLNTYDDDDDNDDDDDDDDEDDDSICNEVSVLIPVWQQRRGEGWFRSGRRMPLTA